MVNIDLLLTARGEAGLVCDQEFESPVAGVMFDAQTHQVSLEFADMNALNLNIPVEDTIRDILLVSPSIQVGIITHGQIQDNREVPVVLINDPAGSASYQTPARPHVSVTAYERFLKGCVTGQPLHRDDLGNENSADSVMSGVNRSVLQFAPHLARQKALEAAPTLAPSAPGMAPGGRGGGGGGRVSYGSGQQGMPDGTRGQARDQRGSADD